MDRRAFLAGTMGFLAAPLAAQTQHPAQVPATEVGRSSPLPPSMPMFLLRNLRARDILVILLFSLFVLYVPYHLFWLQSGAYRRARDVRIRDRLARLSGREIVTIFGRRRRRVHRAFGATVAGMLMMVVGAPRPLGSFAGLPGPWWAAAGFLLFCGALMWMLLGYTCPVCDERPTSGSGEDSGLAWNPELCPTCKVRLRAESGSGVPVEVVEETPTGRVQWPSVASSPEPPRTWNVLTERPSGERRSRFMAFLQKENPALGAEEIDQLLSASEVPVKRGVSLEEANGAMARLYSAGFASRKIPLSIGGVPRDVERERRRILPGSEVHN